MTIETARRTLDHEFVLSHGYGTPGTYAEISVSDSGSGMDEKTKERIFEPFFTTKESGKGTGLGLAMVYGIVRQDDGYINVYSEPWKGTTFNILLPLIKTEEEAKAPDPAPVRRGTETVLVAEDDASVRKLTREALEKAGYRVIVAEDGEDALHKFLENRDTVRLLLLDVIMPRKNGHEVFQEVRKVKPDIKVMFLSGYASDLLQKDLAMEEGMTFLQKPVSPNELARKVRDILDS